MVHAIDIAGAKGDGNKPARQRLSSHDNDMWKMALPVADQIKRFRAAVLAAVGAYRPF